MGKNQHVVPHDGQWGVKGEGNDKMTKVFEKKEDAVKYGREIARNQESELIIHGMDGQIQSKDSYGNDPINIKG